MAPSRYLALVVLLSVAAGCASAGNTLAQDLAWERWEQCKNVSLQAQLKEIRADGQIWITYHSGADIDRVRACLAKAQAAQAQRSSAGGLPVAVVGAPVAVAGAQGFPTPVWKVGDEWAYKNDQLSGASTFVWSVGRTENVAGVPHYVIMSGSREIFHRVSDLAITQQKLTGNLSNIYRPAWVIAVFPLAVGKTWEVDFTEERPLERQTEQFPLSCVAEDAETVTVPAGTFETIRILCTNSRTKAFVRRLWLSPAVKHMVKEEAVIVTGMRRRELIAFKLR